MWFHEPVYFLVKNCVLKAKRLMVLKNGHPSFPDSQLLQALFLPDLEVQLRGKQLIHHQKAIFLSHPS